MSPRCTKTLHQIGNCQHLGTVIVVSFECSDLSGEGGFVVKPGRSIHKSSTDRFGACHTGGLELAEGTKRLVVETN
jgi:hypothetical protein